MQLDPKFLRQHYASLSDEALLAVDRADLVEMARRIFDDEVGRRKLAPARPGRRMPARPILPEPPDPPEDQAEVEVEPSGGDKPAWLEEGSEVYAQEVRSPMDPGDAAVNAYDALRAAAIPCYLDLYEMTQEKRDFREWTHRWRVMVPYGRALEATSVLERDIFNAEFEAGWRTHLEALTDEQLGAMNLKVALGGLYDRIERLNRAYDDECARRGLKPKSASL
ncbi:MAG: hypothetical protein ACLQU1_23085 [Bryobacteraceae bacterium]